jgi:hypothetical protein
MSTFDVRHAGANRVTVSFLHHVEARRPRAQLWLFSHIPMAATDTLRRKWAVQRQETVRTRRVSAVCRSVTLT